MLKIVRPDLVGFGVKHNELPYRRMRKLLTDTGPVSGAFRPFFSIWREPESTVLKIAHENPGHRLLAWPLIASLAYSNFLIVTGLHDPDGPVFMGLLWASLLAFGPVLELLQLFVGAWCLRAIGAKFGGTGSSVDLQVAVAWANVPVVCLVLLQLPLRLPLAAMAEAAEDSGLAQSAYTWMTGALACLELGAIAASVIILVRSVAAVHRVRLSAALSIVVVGWLGALGAAAIVLSALGGLQTVPLLFLGPLTG